ncbi:uncharacterized protein G2W53_032949 [Senna tora]|uniref:Uncharacterized protein n=1 Tax=Senna tora TaxID=362788 RepID=A0A834SWT7_9FABA|nr:uncharacterized protein G2W53_032949 [Senna tora]
MVASLQTFHPPDNLHHHQKQRAISFEESSSKEARSSSYKLTAFEFVGHEPLRIPPIHSYGNSGAGGHSSHSRSPRHVPYTYHSSNHFDDHNMKMGSYRDDGWTERKEFDTQPGHQLE